MIEGMSVQAATESDIILIGAQKVAENQAGTTRERASGVRTQRDGVMMSQTSCRDGRDRVRGLREQVAEREAKQPKSQNVPAEMCLNIDAKEGARQCTWSGLFCKLAPRQDQSSKRFGAAGRPCRPVEVWCPGDG